MRRFRWLQGLAVVSALGAATFAIDLVSLRRLQSTHPIESCNPRTVGQFDSCQVWGHPYIPRAIVVLALGMGVAMLLRRMAKTRAAGLTLTGWPTVAETARLSCGPKLM